MRLDEISLGWEAVEQALAENDGELTPEIEAQLDALNLAEKAKVDGYIFYLKALDGECEQLKKLEDEIAAKRTARMKRKVWLMARVSTYMQERQLDKLPGEVFRFQMVKSGKRSVEMLVPTEQLPDEFLVREVRADKEALRRWLETNPPVCSYARLGEPTYSVRVY